MLRLKDKYKKEVIPAMMKKFGYKNVMSVPRIEKVVVNTGFGKLIAEKASSDDQKKLYKAILDDLGLITGQKPVLKKAKKSIAGFKVREGMPVGASVTLRKNKMYDFLERIINIGLPRSRDFRGIDKKAVDGEGNLTIGIKEHIIFPEVSIEKEKNVFGFEITVVTTTKDREGGLELLKLIGLPIKS